MTLSNQPNPVPSGECGGWALWLLATLWLSAILPPVGFGLLFIGLFVLCIAHRVAAVVCGLALAVGCAIGAFKIMSDPKIGDDAIIGVLFLPWAGFGLWLAANGLSRK